MGNTLSNFALFVVTEKAMRPASDKRQCFYCQQLIGEYHKTDCVLVRKSVKVKMITKYEIVVPASWDQGNIEFHRNESSWCADNAINELQKIVDKDNGCICGQTNFEYLGNDSEAFLDED